MRIHKEGYQTIIIVFLFLIFLNLSVYRLSTISWLNEFVFIASVILLFLLLYFFRDPRRILLVKNNKLIYAPADGKVVVIEDTLESEFFNDKRLLISIFMSPLDVHSNHHPIEGKIVYKKHHPGKYLVAWHPKSSLENERTTTVYESEGVQILVRQIAGAVARRIVNYAKPGDQVNQGEELGFIKFGSRVDLFLPLGTQYNVHLDQHVKYNIDTIAELI